MFEWTDFGQSQSPTLIEFILSFSSLFHDKSKDSSKASGPNSAIKIFLLQMWVSPTFLKVIQ
jgi:hypothetical protein